MIPTCLIEEYEVARDTRLGSLAESGEPEPWMIELSDEEAKEHVEALKEGHEENERG